MCLVMSKKYKSYSKEDKLSLLRDYYQSGLFIDHHTVDHHAVNAA